MLTLEERTLIAKAQELVRRDIAEQSKDYFFSGKPSVRWSIPHTARDGFGRMLTSYAGIELTVEQAEAVAAIIFKEEVK